MFPRKYYTIMKFRNISDLTDKDLKETPFEFLIMKINDICLVSLNRKLKELDLTINQAILSRHQHRRIPPPIIYFSATEYSWRERDKGTEKTGRKGIC